MSPELLVEFKTPASVPIPPDHDNAAILYKTVFYKHFEAKYETNNGSL